jgi:serine/threonine protein kinase
MGEVYEAEDLELKERLALKTIRPESALSPQMLARFKQELMLARRIRSRHICRVNELYILPSDSQLPAFLTMELLAGPTLWSVLKDRGALPLDEVRGIASQLCEALDAAHAEGIVHSDFKSSNVILTSTRAVVTDFGLARNLAVGSEDQTASAITTTGAVLGTPAYMAPEQFEGHAVTPAKDIYALGVVLYEMLTGKPPFAGQTFSAAKYSFCNSSSWFTEPVT